MNRIKNLFRGSSLAIVIAGLVIAGVASAALVNYLSNYTTTTATLTSPIEMSVNEGANGAWTGNPSISIATTGGSDFTFTTVAKNTANNTINGYPVIVAVAPADQPFTGGEITKVMFGDKTYWPEASMIDITNLLCVVYADGSLHALSTWIGDSNKLVLYFDNTPANICDSATTYPIGPGEINWNVLTITPNQAIAPGTYQIYAQYASDLAQYATYQYGL